MLNLLLSRKTETKLAYKWVFLCVCCSCHFSTLLKLGATSAFLWRAGKDSAVPSALSCSSVGRQRPSPSFTGVTEGYGQVYEQLQDQKCLNSTSSRAGTLNCGNSSAPLWKLKICISYTHGNEVCVSSWEPACSQEISLILLCIKSPFQELRSLQLYYNLICCTAFAQQLWYNDTTFHF